MVTAVLALNKISRNFGAIQALSEINLELKPGQVLGLMGDNGAGKSTLLKIIAGTSAPSSGSIEIEGKALSFYSPRDARSSGIEVVYQDLALCPNLDATANLFLGRELRAGFWPFTWLKHKAMQLKAAELFQKLQSDIRPWQIVKGLSGGQRQAVAIARTLLSKPKIVLLDEPTAAISVRQVAEVLELIRQLKNQGVAVILVSHRMPDIFSVCDRVAVLRRGQKVADKDISSSSPQEVTGLITGAIEAA